MADLAEIARLRDCIIRGDRSMMTSEPDALRQAYMAAAGDLRDRVTRLEWALRGLARFVEHDQTSSSRDPRPDRIWLSAGYTPAQLAAALYDATSLVEGGRDA